MLIHWRRANLRGTLFSELPDGRLIKPVGHAYDVGGPLSGVKATNGAVVDSTTIVIYFSQCVSFSGPLFTGIEYSIDGGAWTTVTGENKVSDTQWEFTTGTIPINAEVRWRYVEGSGTLVDCVDAEDIGEQGPLNLSQGLQGYYLSANFEGLDQKLVAAQVLGAADGVQVSELRVRTSDDVVGGGQRAEILGSQFIYGTYTTPGVTLRQSFNSQTLASKRFGLTLLIDESVANNRLFSLFAARANDTGSNFGVCTPSIGYDPSGALATANRESAGYLRSLVESIAPNSLDRFGLAIVLGGYNSSRKPFVSGDDPTLFELGSSMFYKHGTAPWRLAFTSPISQRDAFIGVDGEFDAQESARIHSARIPIPRLTQLFANTAFLTTPVGGAAFAHKADTQIEFKLSAFSTAGDIEVRFRSDWAVLIGPTGDVTLIEDAGGARISRGSAASAATDTSRIVVKAYGSNIRVIVDTETGGIALENFEYQGAAANQSATIGVVQSLGTGGGIAHLRSTPWGSEGEYSQLENYPGISEYPGASLEAQSVLTRMSAVDDTEIVAIRRFVDGCVDDGNWDKLDEFYCFALNSTDWLTGFKRGTCTATGTVTHTAQGAEVTDGVSHLDTNLDPTRLHNYSIEDAEAGVLMYVVPDWGTPNNDIFGVRDASNILLRLRHRGNDTNDVACAINEVSDNVFLNDVPIDDLDSFVYSVRVKNSVAQLLKDGVALTDAQGGPPTTIPDGGNIWLFRSQYLGAGEFASRPGIMSVFYIGAALDTAKLATRIKQLLFDILPESFVLIETGGEDIMLTEEDTDLTNGIKMEFSS